MVQEPLPRAPGTIAAIVIICLSILLTLTLGKNVGCLASVSNSAVPYVPVSASGTSDAGAYGCEEDRCPFPPKH